MYRCFVLAALTVLSVLSSAQAETINHRDCLEMAGKNPDLAFDMALEWRDSNGGRPARHCAAVALFRLDLFEDAAPRFEQLARETEQSKPEEAAYYLSEAALAWQMAGRAGRAHSAYSNAIDIYPEEVTLYLDRAALLGEVGRHEQALADLDAAINLDPEIADIWLFRAASNRALNKLDAALADATKATELAPDLADAWLEKGLSHAALGELAAAQQALLKTRLLDEEGPAGILAGEAISKLADEQARQ